MTQSTKKYIAFSLHRTASQGASDERHAAVSIGQECITGCEQRETCSGFHWTGLLHRVRATRDMQRFPLVRTASQGASDERHAAVSIGQDCITGCERRETCSGFHWTGVHHRVRATRDMQRFPLDRTASQGASDERHAAVSIGQDCTWRCRSLSGVWRGAAPASHERL